MQSSKLPGKPAQDRGVAWDPRIGKWRAIVASGGCTEHLGFFRRQEDALEAYDRRVLELIDESVPYDNRMPLWFREAYNRWQEIYGDPRDRALAKLKASSATKKEPTENFAAGVAPDRADVLEHGEAAA